MKPAFFYLLPLCFYIMVPHFTTLQSARRAYRMADTVTVSEKGKAGMPKTDPFLENLLNRYPTYFKDVLLNRQSFKVQVIYTQINRDTHNKPSFKDYYFNVDPGQYFYPASTVKMPVALLALQKLHELGLPGLGRETTVVTDSGYSRQTAVYNDPTAADGRPTVANYIKKIFLVSDNDAFNRLYEFLGQDYINRQLHKMGYGDAEIMHRLSVFLTEEENRHTNPVSFYDSSARLLYQQPMQVGSLVFSKRKDAVANGYYNGENKLIHEPMDFSKKNRISLEDQHQVLRSIMFPESVPQKQRFNINESDYRFLYSYMSMYPGESMHPAYDTAANWDAYCKFLYWGSEKGSLPKNIRIFNKVGDAYGFLTDISYFADFGRHIEFMLSATIYCNSDGILNDNKYDYETIGLPFMKNLGRVVYEYELTRKRKYVPDLSGFEP